MSVMGKEKSPSVLAHRAGHMKITFNKSIPQVVNHEKIKTFNPAAFILGSLFNNPKEDATWRDVYQGFAELSKIDRVEMLKCIKSGPGNLSNNLTSFISRNLEDPLLPEMMIHAIDTGLITLPSVYTGHEGGEDETNAKALA